MAKFQAETINHLLVHIEAQKAYMNMKHPDFKALENDRVAKEQFEDSSKG